MAETPPPEQESSVTIHTHKRKPDARIYRKYRTSGIIREGAVACCRVLP